MKCRRWLNFQSSAIVCGLTLAVVRYLFISVSRSPRQFASNRKPLFDFGSLPHSPKPHFIFKEEGVVNERVEKDYDIPMRDVLPRDTLSDHEDDPNVINPHPYGIVLTNRNLCRVKDLFLLVYVHTAADHYRKRALIRQTWGDTKKFPNMRVLFVMGKTSKIPMMQPALDFESNSYGDILEEDYEDTYHNLTHKGVSALKFVSHYCNNAKYVLKTDDDVFVNMYSLQNHLLQLDKAGFDRRLILCLVWNKMKVLREGKWAVPESAFHEKFYPPYCSGMAYLFSVDVVPKLYEAAFFVRFFWVDDVYVSGMLPRAAGFNHTTMIKAYCGKAEMEELFTHPTEWYKYLFTHIQDEERILRVWDKVTKAAYSGVIPVPSVIAPGLLADHYEDKDKIVKKQEKSGKGDSKQPQAQNETKKG